MRGPLTGRRVVRGREEGVRGALSRYRREASRPASGRRVCRARRGAWHG